MLSDLQEVGYRYGSEVVNPPLIDGGRVKWSQSLLFKQGFKWLEQSIRNGAFDHSVNLTKIVIILTNTLFPRQRGRRIPNKYTCFFHTYREALTLVHELL